MNPWTAAAICKAVYTAAETGNGDVRRIRADNPYRISIHVNGALAYADVDPDALTLKVIRIVATK